MQSGRQTIARHTLKQSSCETKKQKIFRNIFDLWFLTYTMAGHVKGPSCVVCHQVQVWESLNVTKQRGQLWKNHSYHKIKSSFTLSLYWRDNALPVSDQLASYKVAYRVEQCKVPHTTVEELIPPCTIDMVFILVDDTAGRKLRATQFCQISQ